MGHRYLVTSRFRTPSLEVHRIGSAPVKHTSLEWLARDQPDWCNGPGGCTTTGASSSCAVISISRTRISASIRASASPMSSASGRKSTSSTRSCSAQDHLHRRTTSGSFASVVGIESVRQSQRCGISMVVGSTVLAETLPAAKGSNWQPKKRRRSQSSRGRGCSTRYRARACFACSTPLAASRSPGLEHPPEPARPP